MIPLFDITKISEFKGNILLPFKCEYCEKTFNTYKNQVKKALNNHPRIKIKYCSNKCKQKSSDTRILINCNQCGKQFNKQKHEINKNNFCSHSCATTYNNTHKIKGINRSKLEQYLENKLIELYPNIKILFNNVNTIKYELDIYIPSLKLAFELNGIYHYEPIFNEKKFLKTQNNDQRKFQSCIDNEIELYIINTSQQKHFKEQTSQKYLSIIINAIDKKLGV